MTIVFYTAKYVEDLTGLKFTCRQGGLNKNHGFTNLDVDGVLFLPEDVAGFCLIGSWKLFWGVVLIGENAGYDSQQDCNLQAKVPQIISVLIMK